MSIGDNKAGTINLKPGPYIFDFKGALIPYDYLAANSITWNGSFDWGGNWSPATPNNQTCCCSMAGTDACRACTSSPNAGGPVVPVGTSRQQTTSQKREEKPSMRGLWEVYIVNPETEDSECYAIVANDETNARIKAAMDEGLTSAEIDERVFIVRRLGDVRPKKAAPQEVKVITE